MAGEIDLDQLGVLVARSAEAQIDLDTLGMLVARSAPSAQIDIDQLGVLVARRAWRVDITGVGTDFQTAELSWVNHEPTTPDSIVVFYSAVPDFGTASDVSGTLAGTATSFQYVNAALEAEDAYFWLVADFGGASARSGLATVQMPGRIATPELRGTTIDDDSNELNVDPNANSTDVRYQTRLPGVGAWGGIDDQQLSGEGRYLAIVSGLDPETTYEHRARYLNTATGALSRWSAAVLVTTQPTPGPPPGPGQLPEYLGGWLVPRYGEPVGDNVDPAESPHTDGSAVQLSWNTLGLLGTLDIDVSDDYGETWTPVATGLAIEPAVYSWDTTTFIDGTYLLRLFDAVAALSFVTVVRIDNVGDAGQTTFQSVQPPHWTELYANPDELLIDAHRWGEYWARGRWSAFTFSGGSHYSNGEPSQATVGRHGKALLAPRFVPIAEQVEVTGRVRIASDGGGFFWGRYSSAELRHGGFGVYATGGRGTLNPQEGIRIGVFSDILWQIGDCHTHKGQGVQGTGTGSAQLEISIQPGGAGFLINGGQGSSFDIPIWAHSYHCPRGWAWYTCHLLITRLDASTIRVRGHVSLGPVDTDQYWQFDQEVNWTANCGLVGFTGYHFGTRNDSGWSEFQQLGITTIEEGVCEPEIPPPPAEVIPPPGKPCVLEFTKFASDRVTPAWTITTDPDGEHPFLIDPGRTDYSGQEIDVAAGSGSLVNAVVPIVDDWGPAGDQQRGWLTERLADELSRSAIRGFRGQFRRYVDELSRWVTIADGPCGVPYMRSFPAYSIPIRDTREAERKLTAFDGGFLVTTPAFPRGLLELESFGFVVIEDEGGMVVDVQQLTGGPASVDALVTSAARPIGPGSTTGIRHMRFPEYWPPGDPLLGLFSMNLSGAPPPDFVLRKELLDLLNSEPRPTGTFEANGREIYHHTWPYLEPRWRLKGSGDDWTVAPMEIFTSYSSPLNPLLHEAHDLADVTYIDESGVSRTIEGQDIIYGWLLFGELNDIPGTPEIEFQVGWLGPVSEWLPYHYEGELGGFFRNLFDGQYSRRDEDGEIVATGIRYDPDALDAMTDFVRMRITEPIDDIREWAEDHLYRVFGYIPRLDFDGRVSPVSQLPPATLSNLITIDDTVAAAEPSWTEGERIVNVLKVAYTRGFNDSLNLPTWDGASGDKIWVRPISVEYREDLPNVVVPPEGSSIALHGEELFELDGGQTVIDVGVQYTGASAMPPGEEMGRQVALARRLGVYDRYLHGVPGGVVELDVRREITSQLQNGDWVRLNISWLPSKSSRKRHLDYLAQVVALNDFDCAWQRHRFELVRPWVELAGVALTGGSSVFTSGNRFYDQMSAATLTGGHTALAPSYQQSGTTLTGGSSVLQTLYQQAGVALTGGESTLPPIYEQSGTTLTGGSAVLSAPTLFTVTIPSGTVGSNLTDFPVLVRLADMPAEFWAIVKEDGGDIRVRDDGGDLVPIDLVRLDYTSQDGSLWFLAASVLAGSDNVWEVEVGEAAFDLLPYDDANGRDAVWADYQAVYLLGETPHDRTGNGAALELNGEGDLFEIVETGPDINCHDGIATDGSHYYGFDTNAIRKFDLDWNLVTENTDPAGDAGGDITQIGGGTLLNGLIYVSMADPSPATEQWIGVFLASDLSFVDKFDITATGIGAADFTVGPDGNLYTIRHAVSGIGDIDIYDPSDGSHVGDITLSEDIFEGQGIEYWRGAFWVAEDSGNETARVETDGTVHYPGLFGIASGAYEGICTSPDGEGLVQLVSTSIDVARIFRPYDAHLAGGGGAKLIGSERLVGDMGATNTVGTTWSMAISYSPLDDTEDIAISYTDAGTGDTNRVSAGVDDGDKLGVWDTDNGWLYCSTNVDPAVNTMQRLHVVYEDTTQRTLYYNGGAQSGVDSTITAKGASDRYVVLGNAYEGGNGSNWNGRVGFAYLRAGALSADWIAAEHLMLHDRAAFYYVGDTAPTPEDWSPARLAVEGVQIWSRIDSLSALSNNDTIAVWPDEGGQDNDPAQGTAANRPIYHTNVLNSWPAVRFDNTTNQKWFDIPNVLSGLPVGQIIAVLRVDTDPPTIANNSGLWLFGASGAVSHYPFTDSIVYDEFATNSRKTTGNPTASLATKRIYNVLSKAGRWTSKIDGTQHFTTATNTVAWSTIPRIGNSTSNRQCVGYWWEFILLSRELTAEEEALLMTYLARYDSTP